MNSINSGLRPELMLFICFSLGDTWPSATYGLFITDGPGNPVSFKLGDERVFLVWRGHG